MLLCSEFEFIASEMIDDDILDEIGWFGFNQTLQLFDVEEERIYKAGAMLDQVAVTLNLNLVISNYVVIQSKT